MSPSTIKFPDRHWSLDPSLTFLNHGSYGAVPVAVQETLAQLRQRCERDPVRFFKVDLADLLDEARSAVGGFINCRPADLGFMPNATVALATILANTPLEPGDEILITDHEYQSLLNELERVAARTGAVVVKARIPFPLTDPAQVVERYLGAVSSRTKLALISHCTSATALIFPVAPIVAALNARGIDVCVDGAHAPGQIPVDVAALNPTYYIGSGHKWLCGPKGAGFMFVRADRQGEFRSLWLSSRAHKDKPERARYLRDFDYFGTADYTPILALPAAIREVGAMHPGGWAGIMRANTSLSLASRALLSNALGVAPAAPDSMVGAMFSLPIPEPAPEMAQRPTIYDDALQDELLARHRIQVPVWRLNADDRRIVRVSAQIYNSLEQYERLGRALGEELSRERGVRATG